MARLSQNVSRTSLLLVGRVFESARLLENYICLGNPWKQGLASPRPSLLGRSGWNQTWICSACDGSIWSAFASRNGVQETVSQISQREDVVMEIINVLMSRVPWRTPGVKERLGNQHLGASCLIDSIIGDTGGASEFWSISLSLSLRYLCDVVALATRFSTAIRPSVILDRCCPALQIVTLMSQQCTAVHFYL